MENSLKTETLKTDDAKTTRRFIMRKNKQTHKVEKQKRLTKRFTLDFSKVRNFCLIVLTVIALVMIVIRPEIYIQSTKNGLIVFTASVLPALFPFFFFSTILTKLGAPLAVAKIFGKPFGKFFNTSGLSAYVFFMSLICGYPVGAKLVSELYDSSLVDSAESKRIASFCSTSGPLFILGTLGVTVFNDKTLALVVSICHYLSAFLNGFIYRGKQPASENVLNLPLDCDDILSKTISGSTLSMLNLCGYIVVFNIIIDLVLNSGILSCLPNTDFGFTAKALICGCIEMTRGCMMLSKITIPKFLKCGLVTFLVSISGMGILCQSMSFLSKCRIKAKTVVLQKFTQSLIALLLGTIAGLLLK